MAETETCMVCGTAMNALFRAESGQSLISSAVVLVPGRTVVDLCPACGHAQTHPVRDLHTYYASEYNFLAEDAEQDDLYESRDGKNVYRADHQAAIVRSKLDLSQPLKVLDFGCAKSRTLRVLTGRNPKVEPHVFDVSDSYRKFWDQFVPSSQQASFTVPGAWKGHMDLVLSFFALEHVPQPVEFLSMLRSLLKPGGQLLLVVPNMATNVSDLLVVDHVNHFSLTSLHMAFEKAGFSALSVDEAAFRGAFVITARNENLAGAAAVPPATESVARAQAVRDHWAAGIDKVRAFEASQPAGQKSAVYGSGMYGLFIASCLRHPERLAAFLDQNPYRQGLRFLDVPVIAPAQVGENVGAIYVGLNPVIAHDVIASVPELARPARVFIYL